MSRLVAGPAIVVLVAIGLGGCSGDDAIDAPARSAQQPAPDTEPTDRPATTAAPIADHREVGLSAGWGPLLLHVDDASYEPAHKLVTLEVRYRWQSATDFTGDYLLRSASVVWSPNAFPVDAGQSRIPAVPAGGSGSGVLAFPVDPDLAVHTVDGFFDLAGASLVLIDGWNRHTVVPLGGADTDTAVAVLNAPRKLSVKGTLKSAQGTITVRGGQVSTGQPNSGFMAHRERAWLHLYVDVEADPDLGAIPMFPQRALLIRLPDGTRVGAGDGVPFDLALAAGESRKGATIGFPIALPTAGNYELVWDKATLPFTIRADDTVEGSTWAPQPLAPESPSCPELVGADGAVGTPFAFGALSARLCAVEKTGNGEVSVTIAAANAMRLPFDGAGYDVQQLRLVDGASRVVPSGVRGTKIPPGGSGAFTVQFAGGAGDATLAYDLGDGTVRSLVALRDDAEGTSTNVPMTVSGEISSPDGLVRVRDAAVLSGALNGFSVLPEDRALLAVRFDFVAAGALPTNLNDAIADLFTQYTPSALALTLPDGTSVLPTDPAEVPLLYPREQLRGGVLTYDIPATATGHYKLIFTGLNGKPAPALEFDLR